MLPGIVEKARKGSRKLTKTLHEKFVTFLDTAGIPEDLWWEFVRQSPHSARRVRKDIETRFEAALPMVWDALFEKAQRGDPQAIKLFLTRFDPDYRERASRLTEDDMPSYESFRRVLEVQIGEDGFRVLQEVARKRGMSGGIFGERYLPGGPLEEEADYEPEPAELEAEEVERPAKDSRDDLGEVEELF